MNRSTYCGIIVAAGVALTVAAFLLLPNMRHDVQNITLGSAHEVAVTPWVYGRASARFTYIEYGDLECPYCKDYFPRLKAWIDKHPDANLQWHHLPLSMHEPMASYEARWAECAGIEGGNDAFWRAIELIYRGTRSNGAGLVNAPRLPGLSERQTSLDECASNNASVLQKVRAQTDQASLDGITATPTLIVKDKVTGRSIKLQGAPDGDILLSAIDWLSGTESAGGSK
ncbi:thioredoxin domain-containing protein [Pseudomonas alliivorans]|nr:thioredoxin domain-containing protein [Pseudomonas alliivorans]MEE4700302.1 thioredoxin domain-containing protein [Pseudomonas alliivorans]MEE4736281.1 thioredoxin domain-containing protein [Pseudomonas alliivorans]